MRFLRGLRELKGHIGGGYVSVSASITNPFMNKMKKISWELRKWKK
jgi:hypothetical protein